MSSESWQHPPVGHYLSALKHLERTQYFTPAQLLQHQFRLLWPLLIHACETVPHYRQAFQGAGLHPATVTADNWHRVPILTRETLQQEEILSERIPPQHGRLFKRQSSGSTGQPVTVYKTDYTQQFFDFLSLRDCQWHGWDVRGKFASIRNFADKTLPEEGVVLPSWGMPFNLLSPTGPAMMLSVRTPVGRQLQWLDTHQPDYLQTYPSNLRALIEESRGKGIRLPNLKQVRMISETVPDELGALCKDAWGASLSATYSSEELGYMAIQCPEHLNYHVQAENVLLEILDDNGAPCGVGKVGRVVVTSLLNYATPLLRYEIQDYAEVGSACPCGRGLPVLTRVLGRTRNMLTMPSGEKCWPAVASARYREIAPIRQFQFIQHTREHIEMRLAADRDLSQMECAALRDLLQQSFGHPFAISFTRLEAIRRGQSGKYEEFISRIAD